jgi:plastocyanin
MRASYLLILLVILLLVGCAAETPAPEEGAAEEAAAEEAAAEEAAAEEAAAEAAAEVSVLADTFDPETVTIKVGGTVTWTNTDTKTHMVAGPKRLFSEKLVAGASYTHTFEEAGEYAILNVLAPKYYGNVVVE